MIYVGRNSTVGSGECIHWVEEEQTSVITLRSIGLPRNIWPHACSWNAFLL